MGAARCLESVPMTATNVTTPATTPAITAAELAALYAGLAADYTRRLGLHIDEVAPGRVVLTLPVTAELVHGGGVLCGQAILAAADTAMLLAMIAQLGEFRPMTTVQLQASFLRPVPKGASAVSIVATVLRFKTPDGKLAAHATTTYALV